MSCSTLFDDALVFSYSRAQALADGVLVDVSELAREAGFTVPVAVTQAVWEDCIAWSEEDSDRQTHQDQSGRLWDVLTMLLWTIRWSQQSKGTLLFDLSRIARDGYSTVPALVTLKFIIGPGDQGEPVGTILMPNED